MAATTLSDCPATLIAGTSFCLEQSHADYLASDSWVLTWHLRNLDADGDPITWTFSDSGSGSHLLTLAYTDTAVYPPGDYMVVGYVTKATERIKVFDGRISILPDYVNAGGDDEFRSWNRKILAQLKTAYGTLSTATAESVSIEGVSYNRRRLADLQAQIDLYQAKVDAEERELTQNEDTYKKRIVCRFTRPT